MTPQEALDFFGGSKAAIAAACGIKAPSVYDWFDKGFIPVARQFQLQVLSGGKLLADAPKKKEALEKAA